MDLNFFSFVVIISCTHCTGEDQRRLNLEKLRPIPAIITPSPFQRQYLGEIGCRTDAKILGCEKKNMRVLLALCTVTCTSPCGSEGSTPTIWGTGHYSEDSPICRSAVHDYRISPYSSKTNVTFARSLFSLSNIPPSIQQGISSTISRGSSLQFYFTSPYFTEEDILDVTTLNYKYLYQGNGPFIQSCRISGTVTSVDLQFYIPSTPGSTQNVAGRRSSDGQEKAWDKPLLQPGGYWCNIVNNTYSDVMSLAMASDADFLPDQWTLTTSILENVVIKFTPKQMNTTTIRIYTTWRKDQQVLYSFPNMRQYQNKSGYYLEIDNVQSGDAGIYSLDINDKKEKQGITRLVVRRCKRGIFGPGCDQECPNCQNGGVCHDIMGNCICPPGFNGIHCENRCAAGYFGQSCSQSCASSRHAISNSCKGAMICLPDPYGCSCAAGYKGLACDEEVEGEVTPTTIDTTTEPTTSTLTAPTTTATTPTTTTTRPTTTATTPTTTTTQPTTTATTRTTVTTPTTPSPLSTTATTPTTVTTPTTPSPLSTPPTSMLPQERMCQSAMNSRNSTVVLFPDNDCQFGCIQQGRKVVHILKTDGERCNKGICVKGFCHQTTANSVCPSNFNGVRRICKMHCYSAEYPGMSMVMDVRAGDVCIEKDQSGTCMNGKCVKLLNVPEDTNI